MEMLVRQTSALLQCFSDVTVTLFSIKMKIFDSFDEGWQYTKKHGIIFALLLFCAYILFNFLTLKCFPDEFWELYTKMLTSGSKDMTSDLMKLSPYFEAASVKIWLVYMLQFLIMTGILNVALSIHIGETKGVSLKYISLPFKTYLRVIEYGCCMMLLFMTSVYAAFLPFIYFGVRLMFVIPLLLEEPDCGLLDAFKMSWEMTKGGFFNLMGFFLLCCVVCLTGFLCLLVGVFVSYVVCMFAYLTLYREGKMMLKNN